MGTKALTVTQKQIITSVSGKLFSDIDFQGLSKIIDNIGNSDTLTDSMKGAAAAYINEWENLVVRKLQYKKDTLTAIRAFIKRDNRSHDEELQALFDGLHYYNSNVPPQYDFLVNFIGTSDTLTYLLPELEEIKKAYEELKEHREEAPVQSEYETVGLKYNEAVKAKNKYEVDRLLFMKEQNRRIMVTKRALTKFHKKFAAEEYVNDFKKVLTSQINQAEDALAIVKEMAAKARMNITISDQELRQSLRELSNFQKTLF